MWHDCIFNYNTHTYTEQCVNSWKMILPNGNLILQNDYLRERQCCNQINEEIRPNIPLGDFLGIHHKFTPPKHPRAWGNISCPELYNHVQQIEKIRNSPKTCNHNSQIQVCLDTPRALIPSHSRQIKIQWINKKCHQARDNEDSTPL